ncbi:glutamine synthetase [Candidatus Bathyarchaeota archaeon]|nr:glutamine synthetase [Candidatus Bathyarchaeota archaeon]
METQKEVVKLVQEKDIRILDLCHMPEDGRLKTLSFAVKNRDRLQKILELGARVDGSSLFSCVESKDSDIYVVPRPETAFIDPFSPIPTLKILCDYLDENGKTLEIAPSGILSRAVEKLRSSSNVMLKALAELEFYIIGLLQGEIIKSENSENNYHESAPLARFEIMRNEALVILDQLNIASKYGHAEVGRCVTKNGRIMEQHEIELLPQVPSKMAENTILLKWIMRNVCSKHGASVSFSPKPALEHAGNGMHLHFCGLRRGRNIILDSEGNLTSEARQMIGGILKFAPSLTAFGNPIPVSYLRLISRRESPIHVSWGAKDRLALIRIPLLWNFRTFRETEDCLRTFEFRAPDPVANIHLLLAGIAVAIEYGLSHSKEAIDVAEELNTDKISSEAKEYKLLPLSCRESAENLKRDRKHYEIDGIFPEKVIDGIVNKLKSYPDQDAQEMLGDSSRIKIQELLSRYLYHG